MKKLALSLGVALALCYSECTFSAEIETMNEELSHWTGFYLGPNAGYWGAQNNSFSSTGSPSYINPAYDPGASDIANALAQMATKNSSLDSNGFIGGGQAGYNYEFNKGVVLGLNIDLDAVTNSNNNITLQRTVNLADFSENYVGSLAVKETINYLGTVRARLGYLFNPSLLVYASGGFAYGNVTLDTAWTAQESLGSAVFPTIITQNNSSQTLVGWAAAAGIEWLFKPQWSSMLEYTYYSLSDLTVPGTLAQTNASVSPPVLWGSATTDAVLSPSAWAIRVALNYHFL